VVQDRLENGARMCPGRHVWAAWAGGLVSGDAWSAGVAVGNPIFAEEGDRVRPYLRGKSATNDFGTNSSAANWLAGL
jgi:hypothetical protein